jgi:hypothetical protein
MRGRWGSRFRPTFGHTGQRYSFPIADIGWITQIGSMTEVPRIFFDTNEGDHDHGYWLVLPRSRLDLVALGTTLRDGMTVTLYMPDELEMQATLRFSPSDRIWIADPVAGSIRHF